MKIFIKFNFYLLAATLLVLTACKKHYGGDNTPTPLPVPPSAPATDTWTKIPSLPASEKFSLLEASGNTIYAVSGSKKLYSSTDMGLTWSSSPINTVSAGQTITAFAVFENKIYVATTSNGIHVSADNGKTWTIQASGAFNTSFTIWKDNLYLSSAEGISAATGILVLNKQLGTWVPFNSVGIPSNYDLDVTKTIVVNQTIGSIRGTNGKFYGYGDASSQWNPRGYFPEYHNLKMQDVAYATRGVLLVSSGMHLLYSDDFANSWSYDTVGLKKVAQAFLPKVRVLYAANNKFYVLSNAPAGGTWIQQRGQDAQAGATWANDEVFLPIDHGFSYDIKLLNGVLFIATDNGLYYKKVS